MAISMMLRPSRRHHHYPQVYRAVQHRTNLVDGQKLTKDSCVDDAPKYLLPAQRIILILELP